MNNLKQYNRIAVTTVCEVYDSLVALGALINVEDVTIVDKRLYVSDPIRLVLESRLLNCPSLVYPKEIMEAVITKSIPGLVTLR